jgi:hypothetical protein
LRKFPVDHAIAKRFREAFFFGGDASLAITRIGLALDNESKDTIFPRKLLVGFDFFAHPTRLR